MKQGMKKWYSGHNAVAERPEVVRGCEKLFITVSIIDSYHFPTNDMKTICISISWNTEFLIMALLSGLLRRQIVMSWETGSANYF